MTIFVVFVVTTSCVVLLRVPTISSIFRIQSGNYSQGLSCFIRAVLHTACRNCKNLDMLHAGLAAAETNQVCPTIPHRSPFMRASQTSSKSIQQIYLVLAVNSKAYVYCVTDDMVIYRKGVTYVQVIRGMRVLSEYYTGSHLQNSGLFVTIIVCHQIHLNKKLQLFSPKEFQTKYDLSSKRQYT